MPDHEVDQRPNRVVEVSGSHEVIIQNPPHLRLRMARLFGSLANGSDGERGAFDRFLASVSREMREVGATLGIVLPPLRLDGERMGLQTLGFPYVAWSWMDGAFEGIAHSAWAAPASPRVRVVDLRQLFGPEVNAFMVDAANFDEAGALAFAKAIASCSATLRCELGSRARTDEEHRDAPWVVR